MRRNDMNPLDPELYKMILIKKVWNIHDVPLYTGIPVGSLYNMTHQERIPHRKKGNRLFFIAKEIMNWIEEGE